MWVKGMSLENTDHRYLIWPDYPAANHFTPKDTEEWSNDMRVRVEVTSLPLKQLR